ncbi:MAG: 50S ribosomal protein L3 [Candidatus Bipolaricaulota bacterium]|nr:50S ribosomal protein L3 [Candidatus Bipolaricaulota bacterium]
MALEFVGRKVGMTQWFDGEGRAVAATVIQVEPAVVVEVKTPDKHGYAALQLGAGEVPERKLPKPVLGRFRKLGLPPRRYLYEARVDDPSPFQVGATLGVDQLAVGEKVDVMGITKGKGFQGTIKRWNFRSRPRSHGHKWFRRPGAAGRGLGKVVKGRKYPGHDGADRVTVRNLAVLAVDPARNLLVVRGSVPGARAGLLRIRKRDA